MVRGSLVSVTEAAQLLEIGRQAVFHAMKHGRIRATADANGMFWIELDEVAAYEKSRWVRKETTRFNGKKVFDEESEYMSASEAGEVLGLKRQQMYYIVRRGLLRPRVLAGNMMVFARKDVVAFRAEVGKYNFWVATA